MDQIGDGTPRFVWFFNGFVQGFLSETSLLLLWIKITYSTIYRKRGLPTLLSRVWCKGRIFNWSSGGHFLISDAGWNLVSPKTWWLLLSNTLKFRSRTYHYLVDEAREHSEWELWDDGTTLLRVGRCLSPVFNTRSGTGFRQESGVGCWLSTTDCWS